MLIPKPKAVLFDWSETLVGSRLFVYHFLNKNHLKGEELFWSEKETQSQLLQELNDCLPILFQHNWETTKNKIIEFGYNNNRFFIPYALSTIALLHQKQIPCAIVSNCRGSSLRKNLEELGLLDVFQTVVGAGDAERDKPNPEPVWLALEELKVNTKTDNVWFIGDTEADMECALSAGCVSILLNEKCFSSLISQLSFKPSLCISNYEELISYIKSF